MKEYIRVISETKSVHTKFKLSDIEDLLSQNNFIRIHRSFIVARDKIDAFSASELEVGRSTLSTWENGLTEVKIETLIKLAVILKLENYRQIIDFDPDSLFSNK